jgi:hypothetical protein
LLQGIKLSDALQDTVLSASCLGLLGSLFFHTNHDQALKMLTTCLNFSRKSNATNLEVSALEKMEPDSPILTDLRNKLNTERSTVHKLLESVFDN